MIQGTVKLPPGQSTTPKTNAEEEQRCEPRPNGRSAPDRGGVKAHTSHFQFTVDGVSLIQTALGYTQTDTIYAHDAVLVHQVPERLGRCSAATTAADDHPHNISLHPIEHHCRNA
eukprot:m.1055524 g.1055524  ORF g.1055524 m.1055524 type:complete len:115 (-) comp24192_c1_seq40:1889-2233(-)